MVRSTRLLLIDCRESPLLVQMVPKTLRTSAVTNLPVISQPSLDPAVLPDSPVCAGVVIGQKAYHIHRLHRFLFPPCNLWTAVDASLVTQRLQRVDAHGAAGGEIAGEKRNDHEQ